MAHKKGQGSSRNGRDSNPQHLGVKRFGGQLVAGGTSLVRERGLRSHAGESGGRAGAAWPVQGPWTRTTARLAAAAARLRASLPSFGPP